MDTKYKKENDLKGTICMADLATVISGSWVNHLSAGSHHGRTQGLTLSTPTKVSMNVSRLASISGVGLHMFPCPFCFRLVSDIREDHTYGREVRLESWYKR